MAEKRLKILFVSAEAAPFAKVGGLGEVIRSLPKAMRDLRCDVRTLIPKYATIDAAQFPMRSVMKDLSIARNEKDAHGLLVSNILRYAGKDKVVHYFLENMECFEKRANVYGYADDTMRWVLLSRAALEFVKRSKWKPDFIVANDWETGFIPNLLKTEYKDDPDLRGIQSVFCIHNLRNQGMFDAAFVSELDADFGRAPIPPFFSPDMKKLNGMRRGILYADAIITVSPTYAREILSEEYGEKLDELLRDRRADLTGILNGIDYTIRDPETDPDIAARFSRKTAEARTENKLALQERFGLPKDKDTMVFGFTGRLDDQKGLSLLEPIIRPLFDNLRFQLIVIGTGEKRLKIFLKELQDAYPDRMVAHLDYDEKLPHLLFAGADAVLVPSRFEPSGLVQMEAMRYGAIPIVRKTGGLADSVIDYHPGTEEGTGFVFEKYESDALLITMVRAYESYRNKREWGKLVRRAMGQDFSWKKSAKEYIALLHKLSEKRANGTRTASAEQ